MATTSIARRRFLGSVAAAGAALPVAARASETDGPVSYAVTRSEEAWRTMLTPEEFTIMREGGTEPPKSSPLWEETRAGIYCCKGCDLTVYDAHWKKNLEIGWVFFRHSEPDTVLTSIDRPSYQDLLGGETTMAAPDLTPEEVQALDDLAGVEIHCRRCGSHFGHIVSIGNTVLHCVNGASFRFQPQEA